MNFLFYFVFSQGEKKKRKKCKARQVSAEMVEVSLLENPIVIPSAATFDSIYSGSFWKHLSDGTWFTLPLVSVPFNK